MTRSIFLCLFSSLSLHSFGQTVSILYENEGPDEPRTPASQVLAEGNQVFVGTGGLRVLGYSDDGDFLGTHIDMPGEDVGTWTNLYIENGHFIGHGGEAGYSIFVSEHTIEGSQLTYANVTSGQSGTGELVDVNGDWHLLWASNCCGTGQTWDTELKKFNGHSDEVIWNTDLCYECNNWAGSCSHGLDYPMDLEFFDNHLYAFKRNVTSPCFEQIGIQKIDLTGELEWSFEYPGARSVVETIVVNDEMFVLGYSGESPNRQPFLWNVNHQGEVVWEHEFLTDFSDMEPIDLVADSNGNLRIGLIENGGFRLDEISPLTNEQVSTFSIPIQREIKSFGLYGSNLIQLEENNFVLAYNWGSWYDDSRFSLVRFSVGPTTGCTDPLSCNYNADVEEDDGSCLPYDALAGCMDDSACNFNVNALCEDESCVYPLFPEDCAAGSIACAEGTVWDSMLQVCIPDYAAYPCGEGTVWDPNEEECVITVPSDTDFDGCVSMTDLLDLLTVFGTCAETESEPELGEWSCGDPLEYQGYDYSTVQIGEQCWFAENLRSELYLNGDVILGDLNGQEWVGIGYVGAQAVFENDENYLPSFGRLYNYSAAIDERGLCPSGWHVPADSEFGLLSDFAGGESVAGHAIKAQEVWPTDGVGENLLGFEALPGGSYADDGNFAGLFEYGRFWSSTPVHSNAAWGWQVNVSDEFGHYDNGKGNGFSIRCLKDSE